MVSEMKFGSVIIDVSIDTGGCFETSQVKSLEDPIYKQYESPIIVSQILHLV